MKTNESEKYFTDLRKNFDKRIMLNKKQYPCAFLYQLCQYYSYACPYKNFQVKNSDLVSLQVIRCYCLV
jgi:hypothetical protein